MSDHGDERTRKDQLETDRRGVLIAGSAIAATGLVLPGEARANKEKSPENMEAQPGDRIQFIKGENKDQLVRPEMVELGAKPVEAFPFDPEAEVLRRKYRLNRLLVLKLNEDEMNEETRERSADGVLVFSALCTHRACTIKSWMPEERELRCHCHLSRFAALNEGRVMNGPAKRALPMLPVKIDDEGYLVAAEGFTGSLGAAKR